MPVKVKICGITNLNDAVAAVDFGADALGFVFFKESPRYLSRNEAGAIIRSLPSFITTVGVFVNESTESIEEIIKFTGIDVVQLHGDELPAKCDLSRRIIKAIRVKSLESLDPLKNYTYKVSAFLLDTYTPHKLGGTGQTFNWDIASDAKQFGRIILAGGLTPDNIAEAVRHVRPYGVDVSSGIELEKGKKDHKKMKLFIERAKRA
ncbi:MAG: phosphoribosylanthranilate isomerase [Nitrospirota bacterium]|nr:phosphoribosylanthranilate isomerase [Nitrospirota bacterium]MDH5769218.1 phosphoribosylanthranilate isomerase [Nitrospirota bacterium]